MTRTCTTCGFFSQWLPSAGDCMLKPYIRRNALLSDAAHIPSRESAVMTGIDDTCEKWAPPAEVTDFVHGGAAPPAWTSANGEAA